MNVIVGPSLCFGFNFKIEEAKDLKAEEIININHLDEPVADVDVLRDGLPANLESDNIIDSLKKIESEQDKINILEKAVNANTINLNEDQQNEYIQVLMIFKNNLDTPKLKQLLEDLYK